jgi:hypothetical protein
MHNQDQFSSVEERHAKRVVKKPRRFSADMYASGVCFCD